MIRKASEKDAAVITAIGAACFTEEAWREETVRRDMSLPHSLYFIDEEEGRAEGYSCFWFVADEAQLVNIAVLPEARRKGIASALMEAGMEEAMRRGMASLFLEVRTGNLPAQALYRRHGMTVKALRKGVYEEPKEDGYIMGRDLNK